MSISNTEQGGLSAQLDRGGVLVSGADALPGWTFRVARDRSLQVIPAAGERITSTTWKAVPVGAVLRMADELLAASRISSAVGSVPKLRRGWTSEQRDDQIAAAYRQALLASTSPRAVVARLLGVGEDRAGREISRLREAGLILGVHDERRALAGLGR